VKEIIAYQAINAPNLPDQIMRRPPAFVILHTNQAHGAITQKTTILVNLGLFAIDLELENALLYPRLQDLMMDVDQTKISVFLDLLVSMVYAN
jgi:hypothetical protein